jgi:hypothetical protein
MRSYRQNKTKTHKLKVAPPEVGLSAGAATLLATAGR